VRPGAILAALPSRFEIIYDAAGHPVDRLDHQDDALSLPMSDDTGAGAAEAATALAQTMNNAPFEGYSKEDS
jgi:hypothetical protein